MPSGHSPYCQDLMTFSPLPACRITAAMGQTVRIRRSNAKDFRKELARWVDSDNAQDSLQSWAIVKACRIRHRWPVCPLL